MDNGPISHFPLPAASSPASFRKSYSFVKVQCDTFVGYYHAALMQKWHKKDDEQIRFLVKLFGQVEMKLSPDSLAGIMAHTLIIHGDRDEFFPVSIALEMHQAIPQSYLWVVPNASHVFFFDVFGGKAPGGDLFPKLALEFLRGDWVSA
jgi:pimeloyl-ACP methyl ester carboxylesterase